MDIILVVLAIIGALSGLFKDKSETESPIPKRENVPRETKPKQTVSSDTGEELESQSPLPSSSTIEDIQKQQREQLAERMDGTGTANQEESEHKQDAMKLNTGKDADDASHKQQKLKKNIRNNLNRSGLVNGVIMSEVLGQPRANKPYRTITSQRKNKPL
ncbi:hypothetical protein EU245_00700 [Lentibacillus lipolyticus]|nr:hypothetical protein EU245_00700 [Lentibacillus lipolyticus]